MKITESRIRQIIREESLKLLRSRLPKRRAIKESSYDDGIPSGKGKGSWTYDFGGVGLDTQNGEVAAAWEKFTEGCESLSRFADLSFVEADSPENRGGGEMVTVLEMAKYQIDVILDEEEDEFEQL